MKFPKKLWGLQSIHDLEQTLLYKGLEDMHFDLSSVKMISPICAIWTLLMADRFKGSLQITSPEDNSPVSYMERLDFFQHAGEDVIRNFEKNHDISSLRKRHRNNLSDQLVEISRVEKTVFNHDIVSAVRKVLEAHNKSSLANQIVAIITELIGNIVDHSNSHGYVAVQYYPQKKRIEIALGDAGIGIVQSLQDLFPGKYSRDIVEEAFRDTVSAKWDEDRGFGLGSVRTRTIKGSLKYKFQVLTNGALYTISDSEIIVERNGAWAPFGTYYEIKIWEGV